MSYHLAQINIARLLAPIDDPLIADFVRQLDDINALAESSPGFVWRLKEESGNATNIDVFGDSLLIVNMSVWESIEDLKNFAYKSAHVQVFCDRTRWFEKMEVAHMALWWVPAGTLPTAEEGRDRLLYLREHGESDWAFTFRSLSGS
jgi:hypothetical protein